ncbi:MAG: phosphomannomutase/phosphoglucomutase [Deltaproteobacteria bacterium]|nr:phosphomannomutase/phosphoglucomutase [Candidatus Anaeroferrophillus wilburensis]MBN2888824.1 phosphomannomutase/phosphoglucomutase [Deltaproteobacteria bacterium]
MKINPHIFRKNDIRGHADDDLHDGAVEVIGESLGDLIQDEYGTPDEQPITLAIGRDMRLHSPRIAAALIRGLRNQGISIRDLGLCTTPVCYFSQATMDDVLGSIMVTGSHNPSEFNGLKITLNGRSVIEELIESLREKVHEAPSFPCDRQTGSYNRIDIIPDYLAYLEQQFAGLKTFNQTFDAPITVVADAGNGTAGLVLPAILERLGFTFHCLYPEPDGSFPNHHPDPTVEENLVDLKRAVKDHQAHVGVAFDGDADRLGVVDNAGKVVWGDQLLIIYAADILQRHPGAAIVADVKCSQTLFDAIEGMGGRPVMWKTGHSLIKRKMKQEDALLAGEMSGHIFFAHRYFGYDDAVYATLRLLEIMAVKGRVVQNFHFTEVADFLPSTCNTPELRVDCPDDIKFTVVDRLRERLYNCRDSNTSCPTINKIITIDGVRVVFASGWALVRASNTQPILVLRFEAENKKTLQIFQKFINYQLKQVMQELQTV